MDDIDIRLLKEKAQYDADSQYKLGCMYLEGEEIQRSSSNAEKYLKMAAEQGHVYAQYKMGDISKKNGAYKSAARWYTGAADKGHPGARYALGCLYRDGKGVTPSYEKAAELFKAASDIGHKGAQYALGCLYRDGKGVNHSYKTAAGLFKEASDKGHPGAQYALGCFYRDGKGVAQSYEKAAELFKEASDKGMKNAQYALGCLYRDGKGVNKSLTEAARLFKKAAAESKSEANSRIQYNFGCMCLEVRDKSVWDAVQISDPTAYAAHLFRLSASQGNDEALRKLNTLANSGNLDAMFELGDFYAETSNDEKAIEILQKAHRLGHPDALQSMRKLASRSSAGALYALGRSMLDEGGDRMEAMNLMRSAAKSGCADAVATIEELAATGFPEAVHCLGCMRLAGEGVEASEEEAAKLFSLSASKGYGESLDSLKSMAHSGNTEAEFQLGNLFKTGCGVPKSIIDATEWYQRAADKGHALAQLEISRAYRDGIGVEPSRDTSAKYCKMAALQGLPEAQIDLGRMYEEGRGVVQSYDRAEAWYRQALAGGSADARARIDGMWENRISKLEETGKDPCELNALGKKFYEGDGVEQSYGMAFRLYSKSAAIGDARAQYSLGCMYLTGTGVDACKERGIEWLSKSAEGGLAQAQVKLGDLFRNGEMNVEESPEDAIKWYRMAAENGDRDAQYNLACILIDKEGDESTAEGIRMLRLSAEEEHPGALEKLREMDELGVPQASYVLGRMHMHGKAVGKSESAALALLEKSLKGGVPEALDAMIDIAEGGSPDACYKVGAQFEKGISVEKSPDEAARWYKKAADAGHVESQYALSMLCSSLEDEKLLADAAKYCEMAASQGHPRAQYDMGRMCEQGRGVPQSLEKAEKWYYSALNGGIHEASIDLMRVGSRKNVRRSTPAGESPERLNELGDKYYDGDGVEKSLAKAFELYSMAAEAGNALAQNSLGYMYQYGESVKTSKKKALEWYQRAAMQGLAMAQYNLGSMYEEGGDGVVRSYEKAAKWYQKASNGGDEDAQLALGMLFERGLGVTKSYEKAKFWYGKASEQGNEEAERELRRLTEQNQEFTPKYGDANDSPAIGGSSRENFKETPAEHNEKALVEPPPKQEPVRSMSIEKDEEQTVEGPMPKAVPGIASHDDSGEDDYDAMIAQARREIFTDVPDSACKQDGSYDKRTWTRLNGTCPLPKYEQVTQILEFLREKYDSGISFESSSDLRKIKRHLNVDQIPKYILNHVKEHMFSPNDEFYFCWEYVVTEEGLEEIWKDIDHTVRKLGLYEPKIVYEKHDTQLLLSALNDPKILKKMVEAAFPEFEDRAIIRLVEGTKRTLGESLAKLINEEYGGCISFDELENEGFAVSLDKLKSSALYVKDLLVVKDDEIRSKDAITVPDEAYDKAREFIAMMKSFGTTATSMQLKDMLNTVFGCDVQEEWHVPDSFFDELLRGNGVQ